MRSSNRRPQRRSGGFVELPQWSARRWYVVAFAVVGLSACGLSAGPAVGRVLVQAVPTDIIFGAGQPSPTPAALPQLTLEQPLPSFFTGNEFAFGPIGGTICATAPATGAPADPATTDVTSKPVTGQYQWVGSGSSAITVLQTTLHIPIPQYFNYIVRHVADFPDTVPALPGSTSGLDFTYDTVEPRLGSGGGGFYQFVWKVKTQPQAGDPEGGLSLAEIDVLDGSGKQVATLFKGEPALLLLPLPVTSGPVGVEGPAGGVGPTVSADTSGSSNNMQFNGTVGARERIDACGTWIQAWAIDGTLQSGAADSAQLHLDVATEYGALVVGFNLDGTFLGSNFKSMTTHAGQTVPGAIPPAFK